MNASLVQSQILCVGAGRPIDRDVPNDVVRQQRRVSTGSDPRPR